MRFACVFMFATAVFARPPSFCLHCVSASALEKECRRLLHRHERGGGRKNRGAQDASACRVRPGRPYHDGGRLANRRPRDSRRSFHSSHQVGQSLPKCATPVVDSFVCFLFCFLFCLCLPQCGDYPGGNAVVQHVGNNTPDSGCCLVPRWTRVRILRLSLLFSPQGLRMLDSGGTYKYHCFFFLDLCTV